MVLSTQSGDVRVLVLRDCFGGERVVEVALPRAVREDDLARIPGVAKLTVLRNAPRPFFRMDVRESFLLSGILNDCHARFTVRLARRGEALALVEDAVSRLLKLP